MKFTHFRKILKKTFSLTHAAGVRLQAFTRTRFIVCVTIVPRSYFTDICRIPYRNAPFLPHPRGTAIRQLFIFLYDPRGKAGERPQAFTRTRFIVCLTFCAADLLYRYLPHTLPKATLSLTHTIPPPDSFLFFYMIRAGSFCCTSLYRRARNHKAMRNISALSGCDNCQLLPRAEQTSTPPSRLRRATSPAGEANRISCLGSPIGELSQGTFSAL